MGCCSIPFLVIGCILAGYAYFGRVIYGGIYWGKLRYWNDGYSQTDHIWLITLLQWIFGICLPFASDVMNYMIIHSTRSSNCNPEHMIFPPDVALRLLQSLKILLTFQNNIIRIDAIHHANYSFLF